MTVHEIMSTQVQRIYQGASIQQAAEQMRMLDVGMIPVYHGDRLVGALTDRDLVIRAVAERRDPTSTRVCEVMSPGIMYCFADQTVSEAADMMAQKQVRRLVVLNRAKRLVGVLSLGDLAMADAAKQAAVTALQQICQPAAQR